MAWKGARLGWGSVGGHPLRVFDPPPPPAGEEKPCAAIFGGDDYGERRALCAQMGGEAWRKVNLSSAW